MRRTACRKRKRGGLDDRPVRDRGEPSHPEIEPQDPRRGVNRRLDLPLRLDGDEPRLPRSPDGDVLDRAENRPALAVADPSDVREEDPGGGLVKPDVRREAEGIVPSLLPEGREPGPFLEEVPVGPVEIL